MGLRSVRTLEEFRSLHGLAEPKLEALGYQVEEFIFAKKTANPGARFDFLNGKVIARIVVWESGDVVPDVLDFDGNTIFLEPVDADEATTLQEILDNYLDQILNAARIYDT